MKTPKISLCAIVGNVEEYIERFLSSFAPWMDEIVLVRAIGCAPPDTTLDLARRWADANGRKIVTAEYFNREGHTDWPHVDDFARARQLSFDLATGDFFFWADTDDVLKRGGEKLRELASLNAPLYIFPYEIFGRGVSVPRERMIRRGAPGRWKFAVHESFQFTEPVEGVADDRIVVEHLPKPSKTGSVDRNLRILESIPEEEMTPGLWFHLHQEYKACGKLIKAIECAKKAVTSPDIGAPERYELLCDLARMSEKAEVSRAYLLQAYGTDPCRREALGMLSATSIDLGQPQQALAYARQMIATERPAAWSWNDRQAAYGWLGYDIYQQALRACGEKDAAEKIRQNLLREVKLPIISLLHATRGRPRQASIARKKWLDLAEHPERVEHIFAIDSDDQESFALRRFHHVEVPAGGGCVAAWNFAAVGCVGGVMVQVSDDWTPPAKWDTLILERIGDPHKESVLAVSDGHRTDSLLCMAICTRAYFILDWFLFHPWFTGVYSDNWFTECAYARNAVIDARDLVFEHHHPAFDPSVPLDETYALQNAPARYEQGVATIERLRRRKDWSNVPGFFNYWQFYQIVAARLRDGDTFVEVGVWMGRSIIYLAQECQRLGKRVRLVAVDTFVGEKDQPEHAEAVASAGGSLRRIFEQNVRMCGVEDMIEVVECDSAAAASRFAEGEVAGVFIDAAHDYESVRRDVAAWTPRVRPGGILAGHDADHEPVMRAVGELLPSAQRIGCLWHCQHPHLFAQLPETPAGSTRVVLLTHAEALPFTREDIRPGWQALGPVKLDLPEPGEDVHAGAGIARRFRRVLAEALESEGWETLVIAEYDTYCRAKTPPAVVRGGITGCGWRDTHGNLIALLSPWAFDRAGAREFLSADVPAAPGELLDRWIARVANERPSVCVRSEPRAFAHPPEELREAAQAGAEFLHPIKSSLKLAEVLA